MASLASSYAYRAYIIPPLHAENYATWSVKIEILLIRSELWQVVDGIEAYPKLSNPITHLACKLKDSKARSHIIFHYGEKQILSLKALGSAKEVWDRLKLINERSNRGSQVYLHKQLCHMQIRDNDDVIIFIENWQATLQEAATAGCQFSDSQQATLLLAALSNSWDSFITSQGCITNLTFTKLLSNIL